MKKLNVVLLICTAFFLNYSLPAKYTSRTGHIHVESQSRFLDVIADNYQVYCEINPVSGAISVKGLIKSFEFKMGALDRAFNSDRVNLNQFSKFSYKGEITNVREISFGRQGSYPVEVKGILYIGDYKRKTTATGRLIVDSDGKIRAETSFDMRIEEESVETINRLIKEKLPSMLALDADKLGISRVIQLSLNVDLKGKE